MTDLCIVHVPFDGALFPFDHCVCYAHVIRIQNLQNFYARDPAYCSDGKWNQGTIRTIIQGIVWVCKISFAMV